MAKKPHKTASISPLRSAISPLLLSLGICHLSPKITEVIQVGISPNASPCFFGVPPWIAVDSFRDIQGFVSHFFPRIARVPRGTGFPSIGTKCTCFFGKSLFFLYFLPPYHLFHLPSPHLPPSGMDSFFSYLTSYPQKLSLLRLLQIYTITFYKKKLEHS